jgi:serine phosphatase RsbU (regulator of sigma subunit)
MLLLAAFLIYGQYQRSLALSERLVLERLRAVATTLQPRLNAEMIKDILERHPFDTADTVALKNDSSFRFLSGLMRSAFYANELKTPIYTLTCDKDTNELRLGISSHGVSTYGLLYTSHVQEHLDVYEHGGVIPMYTDEYGTWLSALVPIRTAEGKQIAALAVDYPFDDFVMYAEDDAVANVRATLGIFSGIAIILFGVLGLMIRADEKRQIELKRTHEEIREKTEDLEAGIRYAARMQASLQPREEALSAFFGDHLFIDLPKDTVSGDFLWFHRLDENRALVAVADCTGHGVPGALMTIMGYDLLNDAVNMEGNTSPAAILNYVDGRICNAFGCQQGGQSSDGMDMGICLVDRSSSTITYAGARRPLLVVQDGNAELVEATRKSIGEQQLNGSSFVDVELPITPSDRYFLYSDGLQDQFGGEQGKKLGHRSLRSWLASLNGSMAATGKAQLISKLHEWKGAEEQVDDICLFGFGL